MKRRSIAIACLLLVAFAAAAYAGRGYFREALLDFQKPELPEAISFEETQQNIPAEIPKPKPEPEPEVPVTPKPELKPEPKPKPPEEVRDDEALPESFNLAVPFTSQAPHANWELPYGELCEEASLYMVHAFYEGVSEARIDADKADTRLLEIVDFEEKTFGYYKDTTAEETARVAREYYGYKKVTVLKDPTVEDIKRHVSLGHPVIVPAAGRELGNPNFTAPGPIYHMLVIRGWTKNGEFITNDPGTRRGQGYVYDYETLMNAIHDWNGGDVGNGAKVAIVIYPN